MERRCYIAAGWQIPPKNGSLFDFAFLMALTTMYRSNLGNVYNVAQAAAYLLSNILKLD